MEIPSVGSPLLWAGFLAFVAAMLALDLGVFNRKAHAISTREAAVWSAVWVLLALGFNALVFLRWGEEAGEAFLTGYLIEKALSVDNLFVFYALFAAFRVAPEHQHRLLIWGVVGALILRAGMVFAGAFALARFHVIVYAFGLLLVATGARMLVRPGHVPHPERGRLFRSLKRVVRTTAGEHGSRLFAREDGGWRATPLFLVLLLVEATDLLFAVDSILAILAITPDPFIVFTSNIFAVMGMRSLYFLLANLARRFAYLQPGLALILVFVGLKMALAEWVKLPVVVALGVVAFLLGGSIVASLIKIRRERSRPAPARGVGSGRREERTT